MESLTEEMTCQTCGGPLASGPFGLRCARCVLSLVEDVGSEEDSYVAELFPELHLEGQVAKGGFGAVYRAEHRKMRRTVALKFLDTLLARNPEAVALFEQEMISVGGLDHPGIVRAHDAGERDGHWYIVMEFVDGMDCGALVRKHGHLPVAESCEIIRQAAVALGHAHGKGLVHRDVKPGNVMVSRGEGTKGTKGTKGTEGTEGTKGTKGTEETKRTANVPAVLSVPLVPLVPSSVKVLDFGLAGLAVAPVFSQPVTTGGSTLFLGTLEYISPEQIESPDKVDARADLYSLGATLWRLLTGKTPHGGASPEMSLFVAMKRITSEPVPSLATVRPDLPKPLIQLCDAMLSLDREKRPASAAEVARLLEPWCAGAELPRLFTDGPLEEKPFVFPKKNRRPLWAAAAAVVVAAGIGVAAFLAGNAERPPVPPPGDALVGSEPTFRPLFSSSLMASRRLDAASVPRLLGEGWEPESEAMVVNPADGGRLLADGRIAYRKSEPNGTVKIEALTPDRSNAGILIDSGTPFCFGVAPDSGCLIWDQRGDSSYRHIGRARQDGSRLGSLTFDPSGDFDGSLREAMRAFRHRYGEEDEERRPCGFAFVTEGQIPENTGLRAGDVLIADEGHRWLAPLKPFKPKDKHGLSGLWRCRFDDDEPAQRLGENEALLEWALDVTVARSGVFMLNRSSPVPGPVTKADLTRRLLRWDLDGFHPCTLSEPINDPSGIAADPLSTDLYVIEGAAVPSGNPIHQRLLRLRPAGPDAYAVEPLADRFGRLGLYGVQVTADGQRLVITDSGNRAIIVLKRQGATAPAANEEAPMPEDILGIPGWKVTSNLAHNSPFSSPQFAPGGLVLYCSQSRLRIVAETGGVAGNFMEKDSATTPAFSGVSPLTGHVAWSRTKDRLQPGIERATTDETLLTPLKFADTTPPLPGSFAFVTGANLPPGTPLRPGDAIVAGSRHPDHPGSTSGLWRFRFDNDEPPARLVQVDDPSVNAVTLSKAGVFLLTGSGLHRWDGTALHAVTTSEPLKSPITLAADPLSSDLYLQEPRRLLRLRPGSADTFSVEVLTTAITEGVADGLCFSEDGKRLLVGDYGRKRTWVLERKD